MSKSALEEKWKILAFRNKNRNFPVSQKKLQAANEAISRSGYKIGLFQKIGKIAVSIYFHRTDTMLDYQTMLSRRH